MSSAEATVDLRELPLPGGWGGIGSPSIASADVPTLRRHLGAYLKAIEALAATHSLTLDADGLPTDEAAAEIERMARSRSSADGRVLARHVRLAHAIMRELADREAAAKADAQRERQRAEGRLQAIVAGASAQHAEHAALAERVVAAWAIVQPLAEAVQLLGGAAMTLEARHRTLRQGVAVAADALGVEAPTLPPLDGVPDAVEVRQALEQLNALGRGYERVLAPIGEAHRADELARTLRGD